jgi:formylglycine-generating enzyme required for sulfatase activity
MHAIQTLGAFALSTFLVTSEALAQQSFGFACAGASGVTPTLASVGFVKGGYTWNVEATAPGGVGLGYLLVGFSNTSASALGGLPLPISLGGFFADPLWAGCMLNVDPSFAIVPYTFDPNVNGGRATFTFPGFDTGNVYLQVINIDADFATRIAGVSRGLVVKPTAPAGLLAIEPGTFEMGSDASAAPPYFNGAKQKPAHTVTISYPFWIGRYEVKQSEYQSVMGVNPSAFTGSNRPVESVTWYSARLYCSKLTAAQSLQGNVPAGYEYRLPTEAEWEYACRAGTTTEFNLGSALFCNRAKFEWSHHSNTACNSNSTVDVGSYLPNAWGLYDMHGNVWEWCLDSYEDYGAAPLTDPFVTGGANRVFRGGSYVNDSDSCRSAVRYDGIPDGTSSAVGFRVVLAPILVP